MQVQGHVVSITTIADGSGTGYTPVTTGCVLAIIYVKDAGASPYSNGVGVTATVEGTGESVWAEANVNASASRYPRAATHSVAGVASLYAAAGTAVNDRLAVANDRIKIVLASGGDTKVGAFHVLIG